MLLHFGEKVKLRVAHLLEWTVAMTGLCWPSSTTDLILVANALAPFMHTVPGPVLGIFHWRMSGGGTGEVLSLKHWHCQFGIDEIEMDAPVVWATMYKQGSFRLPMPCSTWRRLKEWQRMSITFIRALSTLNITPWIQQDQENRLRSSRGLYTG